MRLLFAWVFLFSLPGVAGACPSHSDLRARAAAVVALERASGLPAAEISRLLADCEGSQQSMYFCAWRDQLEADRRLDHALSGKISRHPQCKASLENQFGTWQRRRAQRCRADAAEQHGGGSLQRTAELVCLRAAADAASSAIKHAPPCALTK